MIFAKIVLLELKKVFMRQLGILLVIGILFTVGCKSKDNILIISLDGGKSIALKSDFPLKQSLLSAGEDNKTFWTIGSYNKQIILHKYDLQGILCDKIILPFTFYSWKWDENRVFIPTEMILIYTSGNKIFKFDINKNKKYLLRDFGQEELLRINLVNTEMLLVQTLSGSSLNGSYSNKIYNIKIKTGETFFCLTNTNIMHLLGFSSEAKSCLIDKLYTSKKYVLKSYDLVTGEEKHTIEAKDFYCSEAVWSPNGDSIVYDISNNLYVTNLHSPSPILIFKGNDVNIITHLSFISANTILFLRHEDDSFQDRRLIVYNVNKKQEVINKKINARTENLLVVGNHVVLGY